ncbi:hypothetical protein C8A01DRAFT_34328 [Parachaetomium inaequale]|uniref:Uncharacterized protein n=1 Tax=Parachaetomium inaequale TaxID=2588326 RepID=A0AAN6PIH8_9PEZI|nr:hypothetical protein C8A01DRAFT_34328 [Parachaetomium inaequale]
MDLSDLSWETVEIDTSLPAVLPMTTIRHVDLTKTWDKLYAAPQHWSGDEQDTNPNALTTQPLDAVEIDSLRLAHAHLLDYFLRIYHVARTPNTPYLRWEFPADADKLARMWALLGLTQWVRDHFGERKTALLARLQPVFVERHNGLHFGRWAHDLGMRQAKRTGLFVQMFGALYESDPDVTGFGGVEKKRVHVMWPFFGCISYEPGHPAWAARATEKGPRLEGNLIKAGRGDLIPVDWEGAIKAQEERYKAGQRRKTGKGRKNW